MTHIDPEIAAIYDGMWQKARPLLAQNVPEIDSCLAQKQPDLRRGLTLIARLKPDVVHNSMEFVEKLHAVEPDQYYKRLEHFHVTVLSLFTATTQCQPYFDRKEAYRVHPSETKKPLS